jgi:hypothetical protein
MKKAKYYLIPVLATLVGLVVSLFPTVNVTRQASAAPRAAVVTKYLMIPAAAFTARFDQTNYHNYGSFLGLDSGTGDFYAPVNLPAGARIRLIRLFANDSNSSFDLCAKLYESHPKYGTVTHIKQVCTVGSGGNQQPVMYLIHNVKWYYGYYVWLTYPASSDLDTYSVMIKYTVDQ